MALQKSVTSRQGFAADYWRVLEVVIDYDNNTQIIVGLYKDAAARAAGGAPLEKHNYPCDNSGWFDSTTQNVVNQNPQERAYEYLKTLPEFSGATDV